VVDHDESMERLDEATCRRLLGTAHLGRQGFTDDAMPAIVPVTTYSLQDDSVVIPARHAGSLMSAVRGAVVALHVDSYRDELGPGWSVTVVGPTRPIRQPEGVARIEALDLFPDGTTRPGGYVAVRLALVRDWCRGGPEAGRPVACGDAATARVALPAGPQNA
jgi:hypothetical protein